MLRWARQQRRLSQTEFGKQLGVTRQQVHLFESKGANPRTPSHPTHAIQLLLNNAMYGA